MSSFTDRFAYFVVRTFLFLVRILPLKVAYMLCEGIGLLVFALDARHRKIALTNLAIAFPDQSQQWRRRIARGSFRQLGTHAVEIARLVHEQADQVASRVRYDSGRGLENYLAARRQGKGVIFITAHISAWELLPAAHAISGRPLAFVVRPLDNPFLDRWASRLRSKFNNRVIPKDRSLRQILRLLKQGEDVGLLIDQNVQAKDGVFASFFGHTACTVSSPAAIALKTGLPVVPGFILPDREKGFYRIRFYPPVEVSRSGDAQLDLKQNTERFNSYVEEVIREFPHCWLWGHRRFQTQPVPLSLYETQNSLKGSPSTMVRGQPES